ncbi:MAG TPA: hypothetical protein VGP94_00320, partial [Tepidisphaeraceae bacterium]|nr:hypothetical protein [Tepidisphaeraceae bacterium]
MRAFCVCIEQFESRTLLAAGFIDGGYMPQFQGTPVPDSYDLLVRSHIDNKSLHYAGLNDIPTLWRQNSNGSLDTSFGSGGKLTFAQRVADVEVSANGRINVTFWSGNFATLHVARFNPNGTPDNSFGGDGDVSISTSGRSFSPNASVVQTDGKIVVAGTDQHNGVLYRINANGTLDTSFGSGGAAVFAPEVANGALYLSGLAIRPADNRIVVTGTTVGDNYSNWNVMVLAPNGTREWLTHKPDQSSNVGGNGAMFVAVDGDGSIVVDGYLTYDDGSGGVETDGVLVRYPAPKSTAGVMLWNFGPLGSYSMALQPDGKVIVGAGLAVRRFNYNLTPDTTFGYNGAAGLLIAPTSLALQGDGKLLIDGSDIDENGNVVLRLKRLTGDTSPAARASDGTLNIVASSRNDRIVGSAASGVIGITNNGSGPFVFSSSSITKLNINAGDGNDTVTLSGALPASILNGGNGNDTLTGADGADTLNPGLGNDILKGGNNRDTVTYAGRNANLILSIDNLANDGQSGEFDNIASDIETVVGGNANDRITGSDATNALYGGPGNDVLIGKAGNDLLGGQDGNDTMDGGAGSDGFFGNNGIDTADYSNRWDALIITQDELSNDGKAGEYDNVHNDVEVIKGGNLADKITGGNLNNTLYGLGGNDTLNGGGGNDAIYGGVGNDQLTGSAGADSFFGEDGDDTLFARDGLADLLLSG